MFDPSDFYSVAKHLKEKAKNENSEKEAFLRSYGNRLYYSIYLLARDVAEDKLDYRWDRSSGAHTSLIEFYKHKNIQNISNALEMLHLMRKNCDYKRVLNKTIMQMLENQIYESYYDGIIEELKNQGLI